MPERRAGPPGLDVYLLPAVVGGGLGDIVEVSDAADWLRSAGFRPVLYRSAGRPFPKSVEGPWTPGSAVRTTQLRPGAERALTIAPNWGVSAAPDRPGALGRGGPWAVEAVEIEARYGTERTLHVSLEEFGRTLTSRRENAERWREGGARSRALARDRTRPTFERDVETFHAAFRTFRGFDRPNVLHLFQTFAPDPEFGREFPEAVQVGPIWPRIRPVARPDRARWVWYASPASSERIVAEVDRGLRGTPVRSVLLRSPRPLAVPSRSSVRWRLALPMASGPWRRTFAAAGVRIVTGSRTLLEAIAVGGPFLYYNGTMGDGPRRRRHRPEKVQSLLRAWRGAGVSDRLRRDLADFARGRRVAQVVRAAATDPTWGRPWPRRPGPSVFPRDRADGAGYLIALAQEFAEGAATSDETVARRRRKATDVKVQDG